MPFNARNADILIKMLARTLGADAAVFTETAGDIDWGGLFALAVEHRVDTLLLDEALRMGPPSDIAGQWQARAMAITLAQMQITEALHETLRVFDSAGIKVAVLKGVVLKALYPDPDARQMSDADLLISGGEFGMGRELLQAGGFTGMEGESNEDTFICVGETGLRVELHRRLFDVKKQGFLKNLNEDELFPISRAIRFPAYGGEVWSMPPTEHALFQLLHMAKHMVVTGFGLRQVIDFALFSRKYDESVDWVRLAGVCETLGLTRFAAALIWICENKIYIKCGAAAQYLRDTQKIPQDSFQESFQDETRQSGENLLADIMDAGVFGKSTDERTRSAAVVYRAFDADGGTANGWLAKLRRAIFIRRDELHPPYMYAAKRPYLLPVAWAHRLVIYLTRRGGSEALGGMRVADERLALLRGLGMIK